MSERVHIIDYGLGNLRSVENAFAAVGADPMVTDRPEDLRDARRVVLPGVGAFGDGMEWLRSRGWVDALETEVRDGGKPFLGLCLGMQVLATVGTEHGTHAGLGWIGGGVERIATGPDVRIPHMGWNDVTIARHGALLAGLGEQETFYFVHSYVLRPDDLSVVTGTCRYGAEFVATIECGHIFGTQFHPEKSHTAGLRILANFLAVPCA